MNNYIFVVREDPSGLPVIVSEEHARPWEAPSNTHKRSILDPDLGEVLEFCFQQAVASAKKRNKKVLCASEPK